MAPFLSLDQIPWTCSVFPIAKESFISIIYPAISWHEMPFWVAWVQQEVFKEVLTLPRKDQNDNHAIGVFVCMHMSTTFTHGQYGEE